VNVLSRSQVAGVLRRMDLPEDSALDVPLALEVAERFGAGAVFTASVSRLGPQYVVSGRTLRAEGGDELFAVRVAASESRLLEGVETLSREVRRRLGETRGLIRESLPLPEVTTRSMDALRAYAEAERAIMLGDGEQASALAAEAVRADPSFAMAHRLAAVAAFNRGTPGVGRAHAARAYESRDRLSDRERWHVEAFYHLLVELDVTAAVDRHEMILSRYPDDHRATNNLGTTLQGFMSDPGRASVWYERASELDPNHTISLTNLIDSYGLAGRLDDADRVIMRLEGLGDGETALRMKVRTTFARGEPERALALCESIRSGPPRFIQFADDRELCGSLELAMGRVGSARVQLEEVVRPYLTRGQAMNALGAILALATLEELLGRPEDGTRRIAEFLNQVDASGMADLDRTLFRTHLQVALELRGRRDLARRVGEEIAPFPDPEHWIRRQADLLVEAARAVHDGRGLDALAALREAEADPGKPLQWDFIRRMLTARAYEVQGNVDGEAAALAQLVSPALTPFVQSAESRAHLPVFLLRLAELEEERENGEAAAEHYRRLLSLWAHADGEVAPRLREVEAALARVEGGLAAGRNLGSS
jgi:hypothetical protein